MRGDWFLYFFLAFWALGVVLFFVVLIGWGGYCVFGDMDTERFQYICGWGGHE